MRRSNPLRFPASIQSCALVLGLCGSLAGCDEGPADGVEDAALAPAAGAPITAVAERDQLVDAEGSAAFAGFSGTEDAPDVRSLAAGEMRPGGPGDFTAPVKPSAGPGEISKPAGLGHYCSMTFAGGGWAYAWDTTGADPCGYLTSQHGAGTIRKAGMFSAAGANETVVWCDGQTWGPAIFRGSGVGPLTAAFNAADASNEPNCVMTVTPMELPIFDRSPTPNFTFTSTGVDFAREGAPVLDTGPFGATGVFDNPAATQVNFKGHARSGFINDHDGWDWGAPESTDLYALASGRVIVSRDYQTSAIACASAEAAKKKNGGCINRDFPAGPPAGCSSLSDPDPDCQAAVAAGDYIEYRNAGWDGFLQGEVYIRHRVITTPSTYDESFVVGYFHVKRAQTPAVNTNVTSSTLVAEVGNGGWTTAPHLHMTVIRETNVGTPTIKDRWFFANPDDCTGCAQGSHNFHRYAVDPYGWQAPLHIDPRGWATTDGAMSPKLWKPNIALPSVGTWGS